LEDGGSHFYCISWLETHAPILDLRYGRREEGKKGRRCQRFFEGMREGGREGGRGLWKAYLGVRGLDPLRACLHPLVPPSAPAEEVDTVALGGEGGREGGREGEREGG